MPSNRFDVVLPESEIAAIADAAVADLAQRLAQRAFRPMGDPQAEPGDAPERDALAVLHALVHLQHAVERQKDQAAGLAAREGAGYPQLGAACNMSRQGARRRWPGLVAAAQPDDTRDHLPTTDRSH
ncbi:hypothetical protein [Streptacidiphilus sp. PB12-B1b]|uniref:hypothetical protein n=1 Tax=Streptacidiphilus sp. PB12-B1b TaxID=2705012 RepID=UPI0015FE29EC|nr:hypothetical protein [Streptacidiphilus sp. PB12-B1b]